MNRSGLNKEEELWRTVTMQAAVGKRRMKRSQDWRDLKARRWNIQLFNKQNHMKVTLSTRCGTWCCNKSLLNVSLYNYQVDEVAKMEEENKRIREEIDSMERRYLLLFAWIYKSSIWHLQVRQNCRIRTVPWSWCCSGTSPGGKLRFHVLFPILTTFRWARLPEVSSPKLSKIPVNVCFSAIAKSKAKWLLSPNVTFVSSSM